jgi:transportin-1
MNQETDNLRCISGYLLKNNAWLVAKAPPEVASFAKAAILQAFRDPAPDVRKAAGDAIISFLRVLDPQNWTEALRFLFHVLDSPNLDEQEVSPQVEPERQGDSNNRLERFRCLRKSVSRFST